MTQIGHVKSINTENKNQICIGNLSRIRPDHDPKLNNTSYIDKRSFTLCDIDISANLGWTENHDCC